MPYSVRDGIDYEYIKSLIIQKKVDASQLEEIKLNFEKKIASPRRYGRIKSIADLIDCLETMDFLSEYKIDSLWQISEHLADDEIFEALDNYKKPVEDCDDNMYALERFMQKYENINLKNDIKKPKVLQQQLIHNPQLTESKRSAIYKVVAEDIGRNWRNFGRELGLKAGDLDNIEAKHKNDLKSRVYDIFDIFEQNPRYSSKEHLYKICEALDNCKRKDIRKSVEGVMLNDDLDMQPLRL